MTASPVRILLVEDSDDDAELVARALTAGGVDARLARVQTLEELERELSRERPDAVLCDYRLPRLDAPGALAAVRAFDPDLPFLCVSGSIGEEQAVELLKSGATDYVLKDRPARLVPSLLRAISEARERAERRRVEEELRLSREQFLQAQKMEAIGRLAGGVAHDFNNILTTISGYGEMLSQSLPPGSGQAADAQEIVAASVRASRLTRQLLALGRRQVLEVRVLDLNEIVRGVERLLRRVIGEDVRVVLDLAEGLPRVRADAGQIEQVLMNLAVNARDAMPGGGVLTLVTREEGGRVLLSVSDNGTGMPPEVAARAFEPFFTTKDKGKGTGLGLASVHGIVSQSGGEIEVRSAPGVGTTFRVLLPGTREAPERSPLGESCALPPSGGTDATVLVVEDEPPLRTLMIRVLAARGYRVLEAADAGGAQALFDGEPAIALAVVDVVLPGLNGPALAERLRARRPGLKVLYISGFADQAPLPQPTPGRPYPFLAKPFTADALLSKILETLAAAP